MSFTYSFLFLISEIEVNNTDERLIMFANQDIATLGVVNVRYCGYTAVVKVEVREDDKKHPPLPYIELLDQPDGGACALNINRFFFSDQIHWHVLCFEFGKQ